MEIVVGLTDRPESREALERAIEEAQLRSARLSIVWTMGGHGEAPSKVKGWAREAQSIRDGGEGLVQRILDERSVEAYFRMDAVGNNAAATLLKVAREVAAELIVIGIRRRTPVGKLVLGSVSQEVLLGADCPVLAVKVPDDLAG